MAEPRWSSEWYRALPSQREQRWAVGLALWLVVWLWVAILVAAERAAIVEPAVAKLSLGWLPCAIASAVTSLYLQAGWNYVGIRRSGMLLAIVAGVAFVWVLVQGYLGGVSSGSLAAVILVAGELQSWLGRLPDTERAAMSTGGEEPSPGLERDSRDLPPAESRTNAVGLGAASDGALAVGALAVGADAGPEEDNRPGALLAAKPVACDVACDVADDEADEEACGEFEADEAYEADEEAAAGTGAAERSGDWLQQMTRSRRAGVEVGVAEAVGDSHVERLEWFERHLWRTTETQVSLHVLFQPAFGERPRVTAEVVEGAGQVSVAELQPHGARLLLKRPADMANQTDATVVWLEAIGTVNRAD